MQKQVRRLSPQTAAWLPSDWQHPRRAELPTGHHLRPLRAGDVDLHMRAVTGSQERLRCIFGGSGWPPPTLSAQQDRDELARQETEMARHQSFSYALLDLGETELLGCVDLNAPQSADVDAEISWWVVDWLVDGPIERALNSFVPAWIGAVWPFVNPHFMTGRAEQAQGRRQFCCPGSERYPFC